MDSAMAKKKEEMPMDMARHASSRVYDLSHYIGLLPQKKMPKMNDTALASCINAFNYSPWG